MHTLLAWPYPKNHMVIFRYDRAARLWPLSDKGHGTPDCNSPTHAHETLADAFMSA